MPEKSSPKTEFQQTSARSAADQSLFQAIAPVFSNPLHRNIGIACSGGLDSSVLLSICARFLKNQTADQAIRLFVLYINHNLRATSELRAEEASLMKLCRQCAVPLIIHEIEPGLISRTRLATRRSLEEIARKLRYAALDQLANELGLDLILLAHHAQDQVEQQLIRFLQGISDHGGMKAVRARYFRPLLGIGREQISAYASEQNITWHEDTSNATDDFLRNRVRHLLIPPIQSLFPGYLKALGMRSKRAEHDEDLLQSLSLKIVWTGKPAGSIMELMTEAEVFFALHPAIRLRCLRNACLELYAMGFLGDIPEYHFFEPLLELASPRKDGILRQNLSLQVLLRDRCLVVRPYVVEALKKGYLINLKLPNELMIEGLGILHITRAAEGEMGFPLPLTIRSKYEGEQLPDGISLSHASTKDELPRGVRKTGLLLIEVKGQVCGILTRQWTNESTMFDIGFAFPGKSTELYKLKLKELGFST